MARAAIIQRHPDPAGNRFCHALADAHAEGAALAGHAVAGVKPVRETRLGMVQAVDDRRRRRWLDRLRNDGKRLI